MGNDILYGIKFDVLDSGTGAKIETIDRKLQGIDRSAKSVSASGRQMGEDISQGSVKGIAKLNDLDSVTNRLVNRMGRLATTMIFGMLGYQQIMDMIKYTEDYDKKLEELSKRQDEVGFAAQRLNAVNQQTSENMAAMKDAIGAVGHEFESAFLEKLGLAGKNIDVTRQKILDLAESAAKVGAALGFVLKGLLDLASGLPKIFDYATDSLNRWSGASKGNAPKLTGLTPLSFLGNIDQQFSYVTEKLLGLDHVEDTMNAKEKQRAADQKKVYEGLMGPLISQEEIRKREDKATEESLKRQKEATEAQKKAAEELAKAEEKNIKMLQDNDKALLKLIKDSGGENASYMPGATTNVQQMIDFNKQFGIGLGDTGKKLDDLAASGTQDFSKLSTPIDWLSVQLSENVPDATKKSEEEVMSWGKTVAHVMADAIKKVGEYFAALIGGNSKLAGMLGGIGGALGAAWGSASGGLGKAISGMLGKTLGTVLGPILGEMLGSVAGALVGKLIEAIQGAPWRDIGHAVTAQFGFGVTDELSKKILELSKSIGQNRAIAQMMGQIVGDITTPGSFSAAASAIGTLVGEMQKGLITVDDAAKGIGDTFTKMAAYAGDNIDKTMTLAVIQVRNAGLQVKEIMDYVKKAEEGAASGLQKWGEALATLYNKGAISGEQYQKQLKELRGYQQQTADNMVRNGSTLSEAYDKVGIKLDDVKTAMLQMVDAENEYYAGIGKAGDTTDKFYSESIKFQGDIIKNYDAMLKSGLSQNQAIEAIAPSLKSIVALQKIYGFTIDAGTQKLIDQATQQGLMNKDAMTAQNAQLILLDKIAEALGAKIPDAIDKFINGLDAANNSASDLSKTINGIGIPKYVMGGKGEVPEIPAQHGFHGDVVGPTRFFIEPGMRERVDIGSRNDNRNYSKSDMRQLKIDKLIIIANDPKVMAKEIRKSGSAKRFFNDQTNGR